MSLRNSHFMIAGVLLLVGPGAMAQETHLDLLKEYLSVKKEISICMERNTTDLQNALEGVKKILQLPASNYREAELSFYFHEFGIDFYRFTSLTNSIGGKYVRVAAVKQGGELVDCSQPIETVNGILSDLPGVDTATFNRLVSTFERLEFPRDEVSFYLEYDSIAFGSKAAYDQYNRKHMEGKGRITLSKMFATVVDSYPAREIYVITYELKDSTFTAKRSLRYRIPLHRS